MSSTSLRALVRTEGVDPQRDAAVVRRIVEGVVGDHDERSLTGMVAPVGDVDALVAELVARVSGFGPLQPFLDDLTVEEIWVNDPSRVFVARNGRHELTNLMLSTAQVQELIERMVKSSGRRVDISRPFVDAMLPEGHRLHVVLEGISRGFSAVNAAVHTAAGHVPVVMCTLPMLAGETLTSPAHEALGRRWSPVLSKQRAPL
jgi:pilus assembly protein CpaF